MVQLQYFKLLEILKKCEGILKKIRDEKEKLLQAEMQESLCLTAEHEAKKWESFAKNISASLPTPSNTIYYDKQLYQQLVLRNLPKFEDDTSKWYLPIILKPIDLPIPSKFAFSIFNQYYKTLTQFWIDSKVDFEYPKELEWKEGISNPDHGVYLHLAELKYDSQNLKIFGNTEDHEPYVVPNLIIKNDFNVQWRIEGKEVSVRFLIFDASDKDLPFLNYLPYIKVEAEPIVINDIIECLMN